jgi:hypothetical protein
LQQLKSHALRRSTAWEGQIDGDLNLPPRNPTDIAKPSLHTASHCDGQEPRTPRSQETQRNGGNPSIQKLEHPRFAPHSLAPRKPRSVKKPASGSRHRPADGARQPNRTGGGKCPGPDPSNPQQWQRAARRQQQEEERNSAGSGAHLRRAAADGAIPFPSFLPPPLPTARRWVFGCGMAEWG